MSIKKEQKTYGGIGSMVLIALWIAIMDPSNFGKELPFWHFLIAAILGLWIGFSFYILTKGISCRNMQIQNGDSNYFSCTLILSRNYHVEGEFKTVLNISDLDLDVLVSDKFTREDIENLSLNKKAVEKEFLWRGENMLIRLIRADIS